MAAYNGGGIYASTNSGASWVQTSAPNTDWISVASSWDGAKLVAADYNIGRAIYTSSDSGLTWVSNNLPNLNWISVTSSTNGERLVAVAYGGGIYASTNSGFTWIQSSAPSAQWYSVASSADGTKIISIAVVGFTGGEIYRGISTNLEQISPPSLKLQFLSGYALLSLYGTLGDTYVLQYTTNLTTPTWTSLLIVPRLSISPFQMIDPAGMSQPMRFYRAVQQ